MCTSYKTGLYGCRLVSPLIKLATVASPDCLKEHGIPETSELSNHNFGCGIKKSSTLSMGVECCGGNEEFGNRGAR